MVWGIFRTHVVETVKCVLTAMFSESMAVFYSYFIGYMIRFVQNEDQPVEQGVYLIIAFSSA